MIKETGILKYRQGDEIVEKVVIETEWALDVLVVYLKDNEQPFAKLLYSPQADEWLEPLTFSTELHRYDCKKFSGEVIEFKFSLEYINGKDVQEC